MFNKSLLLFSILILLSFSTFSKIPDDRSKIERAVLDYIESQHKVDPNLMKRGLDPKLAKRTYWESKDGSEFVMETDYDTMIRVAKTYNKDNDKFPSSPRIEIDILDIDKRVASVKLTADDWIDYMHLYKTNDKQWKIINVLWQYHDTKKHSHK